MVSIASSIYDNHKRGSVGDFLKEKIQKDVELSIVSAYFTIYAFEALKDQLWISIISTFCLGNLA